MNNPIKNQQINDRDAELKKIKAKTLALKHSSYGYYENPKGETFKWDSNRREFVKSEAKNGSGLDPKQYFIDRFNMTDSGNNTLSDQHGQVWKLDFKLKKLVKISGSKDNKKETDK